MPTITAHLNQGYTSQMTPTAYDLLAVIKRMVESDGVWPPYRAISKASGLASINSVSYNIQKLYDNGFVEPHPCNRKGLFRLTQKALDIDTALAAVRKGGKHE